MTAPPTAIVPAARRCVGCGRTVDTPYCAHCGVDADGQTADPPLAPEVAALLRRFNLGAGLIPGFWTFGNGAPVLGVLFWCMLVFAPPVAIGIMIYLLINGNRVALQRHRFTSIESFRRDQRRWAIAALVLVALVVLAALYGYAGWAADHA